ncbi:hypothetical protein H4217_004561 [Coemansia sp. RSA 1939]|nr:hypothetical protein H4217_004561 [Coemansia sp. RSA 1939]
MREDQKSRDERMEREFHELKEVNMGIQQYLRTMDMALTTQPRSMFRSQTSVMSQPFDQSTPHSRQTPTGSSAKEQYKSIGKYLSYKTCEFENAEHLLEVYGFTLPNLGSVDDPNSRISRIRNNFREKYSKSKMLVIDHDGFNSTKELTTERCVQHAMHMLFSTIYNTAGIFDEPPKMKYSDTSETPVDTKYKPDFVFFPAMEEFPQWSNVGVACELKAINNRDGNALNGQIGQYFNQMWRAQPRKLCIGLVAFLGKLHILLNTRDVMNHAVVGTLPFVGHDNRSIYPSDEYSKITLEPGSGELVVRLLAMMFTLDFDQCGLVVPQPGGVFRAFGLCETMETADQSDKVLSVVVEDIRQASCRIYLSGAGYLGGRVVYPVGTTSWVHKATVIVVDEQNSHMCQAVVKIQWCRHDRLTERRIYDLLCKMGIPNIPKVFFGGRIETGNVTAFTKCNILVFEDCGVGISQYVQDLAQQPSANHWRLLDIVCGYIHTIYAAWSGSTVRILHRDISSGNLMVRANHAMVIDWEYALQVSTSERRQCVSSHPLTGTLVYASMGVLGGGNMRSAIDDIESLFYVLAHVIESAQYASDGYNTKTQSKSMQNLWSGSISETQLIEERIKWFSSSECYKSRLSEKCPYFWCDFLLSMYSILDIGRHTVASGIVIRSTSVEEYVRQLVLALSPVLDKYGAEAKHFTQLVNLVL